MKKGKQIILSAAAVCCILTASIAPAHAYFSTYCDAKGAYTIHLGGHTTIDEPSVISGEKHVVISNAEDAGPVYVRAMAFAGGDVNLTYQGEGWSSGGDGYWYYGSASAPTLLKGGSETTELLVGYKKDAAAGEEVGDTYNVIVIYESTPVQYDENGSPYADWNLSAVEEGGDQ